MVVEGGAELDRYHRPHTKCGRGRTHLLSLNKSISSIVQSIKIFLYTHKKRAAFWHGARAFYYSNDFIYIIIFSNQLKMTFKSC